MLCRFCLLGSCLFVFVACGFIVGWLWRWLFCLVSYVVLVG